MTDLSSFMQGAFESAREVATAIHTRARRGAERRPRPASPTADVDVFEATKGTDGSSPPVRASYTVIMTRLRIVALDDTVVFPGMPVTLPVDVGQDDKVLLVPRHGHTYAERGRRR